MLLKQEPFEDWTSRWLPPTDTVECFDLRDLWGQYAEWSSYGAGAEVLLPGGESVD